MITGDPVPLGEYKVRDISVLISWCSGNKHTREHCRSFVFSPCIRRLSSFRMRRRKVVRKMVAVRFSACGADGLSVSKLPAPCQKFSLRRLAGAYPRGFHHHSERVLNRRDWKGKKKFCLGGVACRSENGYRIAPKSLRCLRDDFHFLHTSQMLCE